MSKMIDITDQRFGRLIAIRPTSKRKRRHIVWQCICDCGNECFIRSISLRNGDTKSCGCLQKELVAKLLTTHGMTNTRTYNIWRGMLRRCENPNYPEFKYWGGRGITVSREFHDFQIWYEHIGPKPGSGYSQDRIDNEGNYERGNIRWATHSEQEANSRPNSYDSQKPQCWFFGFNLSTGEWDEDNNQSEFARQHGLDNSHVSHCLHGTQKTHKNWCFQFI